MAHIATVLQDNITWNDRTWSFPFDEDVEAGRFLIGSVELDGAGSTLPTLTVSDTSGNVWHVAASVVSGSTVCTYIVYAALDNPVTAGTTQLNLASSSFRSLISVSIEAFDDNFLLTSVVGQTATNAASGSSVTVGPTSAATSGTQLVFAAFGFGIDRDFTAGTGYIASDVEQTETGVSPGRGTVNEWKYVTSSGTQTATGTLSSSSTYSAALATFRFTKVNAPVYSVDVDWAVDGDFTGTNDSVTADVLARESMQIQYGRDQSRALSPTSAGTASFALNNIDKKYSPENSSSPLAADLGPGRPLRMQVRLDPNTYVLYRGFLDGFDVLPNKLDRSVRFTALDGLARLRGIAISTRVRRGISTGEAMHEVLDAAGWPAELRDIDHGATDIAYWWEEGTDAFDAIGKLVASEGPPGLVAVGRDGEFVFRDRHHRLTRSASTTSQATFRDSGAEPLFSPPLVYDAGWRDVVNSVEFSLDEREVSPTSEIIWQGEGSFPVSSGQTVQINVAADDPFLDARAVFTEEAGDVDVTLDRNSGQSLTLSVTAVGGPAQVSGLQVRARPIRVARTIKVSASESTSIQKHGLRSYGSDVPWAGVNDASGIAEVIISQRAERLPIVSLRLAGNDPTRLAQMFGRDLSDRVTVVDAETGLDDDFYIEQIAHTVSLAGKYHETVFGLEKVPTLPSGVVVLDVSELDVGKLGAIGLDDPDDIFVFDDATQGQFDAGIFAH